MIKLAQYSLVELIQDSGTTCIYMGERTTDGAQVTVKLCKAEYPSARDVLRLRHEYGILKELGEQGLQGIPRAYALENHGAGLALVMERLPGRPLHQVMQSGALGLSRVLHIGSAIAAILEALHRQRIIHKDIKPPDERIDPSTAVNVPQDTASQAWRRGRKPWRASRAPLASRLWQNYCATRVRVRPCSQPRRCSARPNPNSGRSLRFATACWSCRVSPAAAAGAAPGRSLRFCTRLIGSGAGR